MIRLLIWILKVICLMIALTVIILIYFILGKWSKFTDKDELMDDIIITIME